jgi:glucosamine-6-phosphate deaminase
MQTEIFPTPELMAEAAAERIRACLRAGLRQAASPLLCLAAGDTPRGTYEHLVRREREDPAGLDRCVFVGLDEWRGLDASDPGSCRAFLDETVFGPLRVPAGRIVFFDARAADPAAECRRIDGLLAAAGPLTVSVLGIGMTGHLGMNEPGSPAAGGSFLARLDPLTTSVGRKYFGGAPAPAEGYTLGMGQLLGSGCVLLLATGERKAAIVRQALHGEVSARLPASLLRGHPNACAYLDAAAAG